MEPQYIRIRGARTHNLKNISVDLPRNKLIVFTGLSGSGKSSLAFDTLYAEGQRRYVESLSTYARQFLGRMDKPDVDLLEGLSPAVAIEQKTTAKNPRSTVGTATEIYDHLRLLFARVGLRHCPQCGKPMEAQTKEEIVAALLARPEGEKVILLAPLVSRRKGTFDQLFSKLRKQGFVRVRVDGEIRNLAEEISPAKNLFHNIEAVVDRLVLKATSKRRLEESIATVLELAEGTMLAVFPDSGEERFYSETASCRDCEVSLPELSPQLFSFNNPRGACRQCDGLGVTQELDPDLIVPDPSLSLAAGAIAPWNSKKLFFLPKKYFAEAASRYNFDLTLPFQELAPQTQNIILHGDCGEKNATSRGSRRSARSRFEGVIPRLQRLFLETDSAKVREAIGRFMKEHTCPACQGARLQPAALATRVGPWSITELTGLPIEKMLIELRALEFQKKSQPITTPILKEIFDRLSFLQGVGLGYLSLARKTATLSGGEAQRIRLASQIGSRLAGVMYILDEPSIGLHQRDNDKLIKTLENLRDLGNTVIVVEHDNDTIMAADHVLDMGPGPGTHGGEVVYSGPVAGLLTAENSLTGKYLSGKTAIEVPTTDVLSSKTPKITVHNATINNLQGITVDFPLGVMTCVTGVSGSGKSSLVMETLLRETRAHLQAKSADSVKLSGLEHIDKVIEIDQSPIGRTPRSNPATYTGVLSPIRELLAALPEARARGYKAKRFSFNLKGGRCDACEGDGVLKIAMHFLPDVYVTCDACQGKRYNGETLEIYYRDRNIADILAMTVEEALSFFKNIPIIKNRLQTLFDVGLGYITLGQPATTLSGGEAQRIKLARELSKRATGSTLYILDEPTTGLHHADIKHLLNILNILTKRGNTVIVIEHNLDVIKCADYIIDIGPEGGENGGRVVACGTPREVAECEDSHTGKFLRRIIQP